MEVVQLTVVLTVSEFGPFQASYRRSELRLTRSMARRPNKAKKMRGQSTAASYPSTSTATAPWICLSSSAWCGWQVKKSTWRS